MIITVIADGVLSVTLDGARSTILASPGEATA
jgi:hypothetical protein